MFLELGNKESGVYYIGLGHSKVYLFGMSEGMPHFRDVGVVSVFVVVRLFKRTGNVCVFYRNGIDSLGIMFIIIGILFLMVEDFEFGSQVS